MKKLIYFLIALLFAASLNLSAGTYSGGSGTDVAPYQIATVADLIELSTTSADWAIGKYFNQTAHISFDANEQLVDWDRDGSATWDAGDQLGFSPIGSTSTKFRGNYNGQSFTISNLFINRTTDNIGLFGYTNGATISNIGLLNVNITGNSNVGGIVGNNTNGCTVSNSYSSGIVSGDSQVGGLVGYHTNGCTVSNSYSSGTVSGTGIYVGGLVGYSEIGNNIVEYSYSTCSVSANSNGGGLVGYNALSTISNSYSTGNVTRSSGGVSTVFGGFVGRHSSGTITNCYSTGSVSYIGSDPVIQTDKGFAGAVNTGTFSNCFWDKTTSGSTTSAGTATGHFTPQMIDPDTFTGATWDFSGDAATDWVMASLISFNQYPTLRWTGGYSVDPGGLNIASLPNLVWVAENSTRWAGTYTQTANINMWTTPSWTATRAGLQSGLMEQNSPAATTEAASQFLIFI